MPRRLKIEAALEALRAYHRREGRMPSCSELLGPLGYRSKNGVFGCLQKLEELGYLRRDATGRRVPTSRLTGTLRRLGVIAAGFPSPAEEELVDLMSLDEFLIEHPESTFLLTVSGDSMIDAGIHPGDLVLVERGRTPKNNDIVVAQVDEEWTLKYYFRDREGIRLDPANRKYSSLRPNRKLTLGGIVRAVIRKYG
ncbi:MAG: transcriptional repressor LexA [Kiritimatiellia bacterium]|nr:transcriptional repressor LexA [Kiritimatiellia bacterium]